MNKDAVSAFKRELRNYNYYKVNLAGTLKLIDRNEYLLENVHGINPEKEFSFNSNPKAWVESETYHRIREELDRLEKRRDLRIRQIDYIESILSKADADIKNICERIYRDGEDQLIVAKEYKIPRRTMNYNIDRELERILE